MSTTVGSRVVLRVVEITCADFCPHALSNSLIPSLSFSGLLRAPGSWPICPILHLLPCPWLPIAFGQWEASARYWRVGGKRGWDTYQSPILSPHNFLVVLTLSAYSSSSGWVGSPLGLQGLLVPIIQLLPFVLIRPKSRICFLLSLIPGCSLSHIISLNLSTSL